MTPVPGLYSAAQVLRDAGYEVDVFDLFEDLPSDRLGRFYATRNAPDAIVVFCMPSGSYTGTDCTWLTSVMLRAAQLKTQFNPRHTILAGLLQDHAAALESLTVGAPFDVVLADGYQFAEPLREALEAPRPEFVYRWFTPEPHRKSAPYVTATGFAWPEVYVMYSYQLCDRLCVKCPMVRNCQLSTALEHHSQHKAEIDKAFSDEVRQAARFARYVQVMANDIGYDPDVLDLIAALSEELPHLGWILHLPVQVVTTPRALQALRRIRVVAANLFCPSLTPDGQRDLELPVFDAEHAVQALVGVLPNAYTELTSYVGLPSDTPESIANMLTLRQLGVDSVCAIPLYLFEHSTLGQSGRYVITTPQRPSLFGLPHWKTANLDSDWLMNWMLDNWPQEGTELAAEAYLYSIYRATRLLNNGFSPADLKRLRAQLYRGQGAAVRAEILDKTAETKTTYLQTLP